MKMPALSIAPRIFVIVVAGLAVMLVGFATLGIQAVDESTTRTLQERRSLAQAIAGRVDDRLSESVGIVNVMIEMQNLNPQGTDLAAQQRTIQGIREHLGDFAYYVALLDEHRNLIAVDPVVEDVPQFDCSDAECIRQAMSSGKPVISRSFELSTPTPTVAMVVPVLAEDGHVSGVVFVALNLSASRFTELLQPPEIGMSGYAEVVDDAGVILGSTRPELRWKVDDHRGHFSGLIRDRKSNVGTCHSCHTGESDAVEKQEEVMAFAPLSVSRWGVALRQSRDEAFTYTDSMQQRVVLLGSLAFLIALLSTWFLTSRLVEPLQALTRACRKIAQGDLETPIPAIREGELGTLAEALDFMRKRLQDSLAKIRGWTVELEARIQQRTGELEDSRAQLLKANRDLSALNALGDALRDSLRESADLQGTLDRALRQAMALEDAKAACLCLFDEATDRLGVAQYHAIHCTGQCVCHWPSAQPVIAKALSEKQASLFPLPLVTRPSGDVEIVEGAASRPAVCVPLVGKSRSVGIMSLMDPQSYPFAPSELDLLTSIGVQMGIAIENALLFDALREKEEARAKLLRQVIVAQEDERRRIARELHDETSQALTALDVGLKTASMAPATTPEEVKARLAPLKVQAAGMLEEIQRMIRDLRPSLLDDQGLTSAIDWYAELRLKSQGIRVEWERVGPERRLPRELETTLFRVAQEGISNIARHAQAENVSIVLGMEESEVTLEIEDDGKGFDTAKVFPGSGVGGAYGLLGMRERVSLFGGHLIVESRPGEGTRIQAKIPIPPD